MNITSNDNQTNNTAIFVSTEGKVVILSVLSLVTFLFGSLPIFLLHIKKRALSAKYKDDEEAAQLLDDNGKETNENQNESRWKRLIGFANCFSGGVFVAAVLLDLLPDTGEAMNDVKPFLEKKFGVDLTNTDYPLAGIGVCLGLFLVFFVEQAVLSYKERASDNAKKTKEGTENGSFGDGQKEDSRRENKHSHSSTQHTHELPSDGSGMSLHSTDENESNPDNNNNLTKEETMEGKKHGSFGDGQKEDGRRENKHSHSSTQHIHDFQSDDSGMSLHSADEDESSSDNNNNLAKEDEAISKVHSHHQHGHNSLSSKKMSGHEDGHHVHMQSQQGIKSKLKSFGFYKKTPKDHHTTHGHNHQHKTTAEHDHDIGSMLFEEKSALRAFLLLTALTFHSVIEGLALGLQHQPGNLIRLLIAVVAHKIVMALSLGISLAQSTGLTKTRYIISILLFSLASPFGIGVGTWVSNLAENEATAIITVVLQCMAAGTFLYITFFEVLPHEFGAKANSRLKKLACVVTGWMIMCILICMD